MGRFSFRAGVNAETPDFTIIEPDRRDSVRRLTVTEDGHVIEDIVTVGGLSEDDD